MPTIQNYDIYSDETYLHGKVAFALGALICTPRRSQILRKQLSEIRSSFNYLGELKWKKVSYRTLPICESFVDTFLNDKFAKFSLMKVTKGQLWNVWGKSEEERFFKSYYVFLKLNAGPSSRYFVYPDAKSLQKHFRWDTLSFLINRSRRDDWMLKRRNIRLLQPLDSKSEDLLQLADLLLGCLTSNAISEEKAKLRKRVVDYLESNVTKNKFRT